MPVKETLSYEGVMPHGANVPHGVRAGDIIEFSAIRPAKPDRSTDPDPDKQCEQAFENLRLLLEKEGLDFTSVIKVRVYVTRPEYIAHMNRVWYRLFPADTNGTARIVIGAAFLPSHDHWETMISLDATARVPSQ